LLKQMGSLRLALGGMLYQISENVTRMGIFKSVAK